MKIWRRKLRLIFSPHQLGCLNTRRWAGGLNNAAPSICKSRPVAKWRAACVPLALALPRAGPTALLPLQVAVHSWRRKEKGKKRNNVTWGRFEKPNKNKPKRSVIESRLSDLCQALQLMLGGLPLHKHTALCAHLRRHVLPAGSRL